MQTDRKQGEFCMKKSLIEISKPETKSDIYCSTFEWDLSDGKGLDDFALHWIKSRDNAEIEGSDE